MDALELVVSSSEELNVRGSAGSMPATLNVTTAVSPKLLLREVTTLSLLDMNAARPSDFFSSEAATQDGICVKWCVGERKGGDSSSSLHSQRGMVPSESVILRPILNPASASDASELASSPVPRPDVSELGPIVAASGDVFIEDCHKNEHDKKR